MTRFALHARDQADPGIGRIRPEGLVTPRQDHMVIIRRKISIAPAADPAADRNTR